MDLFGIGKAIEYVERQLNDIRFANSKEQIRVFGTNTMVLTENIVKELIHIYGYLLFKEDYRNRLKTVMDLDKNLMFGSAINGLNRLHYFMWDKDVKSEFAKYFERNYIVFRYNDIFFDKLINCSRVRAYLLHDDLENFSSIAEYKESTIRGMNDAYLALKHFKENNIFPSIIKLNNYYVENDRVTLNFTDEISSNIPITIKNISVERLQNSLWYFFKKSKKEILIPVLKVLNPLLTSEKEDLKLVIEGNFEEETVAPLGFLKYNGNQVYAITDKEIFIGRSSENSLVFTSRSISRKHFMIKVKEPETLIVDLESKFGTFLNGNELLPSQEYKLKLNDVIKIGIGAEEVELKYYK
jgi:hypothetical protein